MGVVHLDPAPRRSGAGIGWGNPAAWIAGLGQNRESSGGSGQRLVTVVIARTATAAKNP
jgi:hypothetical protein